MENWNSETVLRLFELYQQYFEQLRQDVVAANRTLGSPNPQMKLQQLTFSEFKAILRDSDRDRKAVALWVRRIIRGHEHEFPSLQAAG